MHVTKKAKNAQTAPSNRQPFFNKMSNSGFTSLSQRKSFFNKPQQTIGSGIIVQAAPKPSNTVSGTMQLIQLLLNDAQLRSDLQTVSFNDILLDKFCKRFPSRAKGLQWHRIMNKLFIPIIGGGFGSNVSVMMKEVGNRLGIPLLASLAGVAGKGFGSEVGDLWKRYLTGPRKQERKIFTDPSNQIVEGFARSIVTEQRQEKLITAIKKRLPRLCRKLRRLRRLPNNRWRSIPVWRLLPSRMRRFPIDYNVFTEIPGNIAGGVSGSRYGKDSRLVRGVIKFKKTRDSSGIVTEVRMKTGLRFIVRDVMDFCPGGAGASVEQSLTVPLSRLEATRLANDVPFEVRFNGPTEETVLDSRSVRRCWR